ncbi:MAG: DUF2442 domain-containing protein [Gemmatimonadetes bacterium]|nr:DUF2442 domain-containing protein [Gemmatimonadota bacterium]
MRPSGQPGPSISPVEVRRVTADGLWLALDGVEHQLLFRDFPWFRDEAVGDLFAVERPNRDHLRWPALDIDLAIDSVRDPARYPLVSRASGRGARARVTVPEPGETRS